MKEVLIKIYERLYGIIRFVKIRLFFRLKIMSSDQTVKYIIDNNCSVARFGDGEFDLIFKPREIGFQSPSQELASKLEQVLKSRNKDLLKCVPLFFNSVSGLTKPARSYWLNWGDNGYHEKVISYLRDACGKDYLFGNTQLSRPYMDYKNKKKSKERFELLKEIWRNKNILIVEGSKTKMGVGNDLFDGARSIGRIIAPAVNAFDKYDEIINSVKEHANGRIVLLALGPTATVMALDLCEYGIQAIDIGHIDIEYEWFLQNATKKIAIEGKFTNEAGGGLCIEGGESEDELYLSQIILRIKKD